MCVLSCHPFSYKRTLDLKRSAQKNKIAEHTAKYLIDLLCCIFFYYCNRCVCVIWNFYSIVYDFPSNFPAPLPLSLQFIVVSTNETLFSNRFLKSLSSHLHYSVVHCLHTHTNHKKHFSFSSLIFTLLCVEYNKQRG